MTYGIVSVPENFQVRAENLGCVWHFSFLVKWPFDISIVVVFQLNLGKVF